MAGRGPVHYEVFSCGAGATWTLQGATEDRDEAVRLADSLVAQGRVSAARVTREALDPDTGAFSSLTVLTRGRPPPARRRLREEPPAPSCVEPADLYTPHARERIGRLLEAPLARMRVTPWELLHRPDLAERLEASGTELLHAAQKIAVAEAQGRDGALHGLIRAYAKLIERTVSRLVEDGRRGAFPDLDAHGLAAALAQTAGAPERSYRLGGAVARALGPAPDWDGKVLRLLDSADEADQLGKEAQAFLPVIEQPLAEMVEGRAALATLLGADLDLGGRLAVLVRLVSGPVLDRRIEVEPALAPFFPPLTGAARRLADWFALGAFEAVRLALARRVLAELAGPRRLRPASPEGEIELVRALAAAITAAVGDPFAAEAAREAFIARSKRLVASDFIEACVAQADGSALQEAWALVRLAENLVGSANKRACSRWLLATVAPLRFETQLRRGPETPSVKLAALAELQRGLLRAGLDDSDATAARRRIGEVGGWIEEDAHLVSAVSRSDGPAHKRLSMLLGLALDGAPSGPAVERARAEAMRLLRSPEVREELGAGSPEVMTPLKTLIETARLAV